MLCSRTLGETRHPWTAWVSTKLRRHASRAGPNTGNTYLLQVRARNNDGAGPAATLTSTQRRKARTDRADRVPAVASLTQDWMTAGVIRRIGNAPNRGRKCLSRW
jgi:hypothetical protein